MKTLKELIQQEQEALDKFLNGGKVTRVGGSFNGDTPVELENDKEHLMRTLEALREPLKLFLASSMTNTAKAVGEMVEGNFIDMNQAGNMAAAIIKGEESPRAWNQAIAAVQSDLKTFLGEEI